MGSRLSELVLDAVNINKYSLTLCKNPCGVPRGFLFFARQGCEIYANIKSTERN